MSVIDYLKKGGKTSASDIIAGLAGVLGIQPEEMAQLWEVGVQKYGSEEALGEALNSAVDGIQDPSSDEFKQAVASVFTEEQTMFAKQGGKLNQLVDRFAKGGKAIDCGCGGKKLKCGGKAKKGGVVKAQAGIKTSKDMYKEFMDIYGNKPDIEEVPSSTKQVSPSIITPDLWISAKRAKEGAAQQGILTRRAFRRNQRDYLRNELGLRGSELVHNLNQRTRENADTFYGNRMRETIGAVRSLDNLSGSAARQEARKLIAGVYDNPVVPVVEQLPVEIKSSESLSKDYEKSFGDRIKARTEATIAGYKPLEATPVNPLADKSNEELAREVIRGIYGNGAARRKALGDRYSAVQSIVSRLMGKSAVTETKPETKPTYDWNELTKSSLSGVGYTPTLTDKTLKAKTITGLKDGDKIEDIRRKPKKWTFNPDGSTMSEQIAYSFPDSSAVKQVIIDRSKVDPSVRGGQPVREVINLGGYLQPDGSIISEGDVQSRGNHPWFPKDIYSREQGGQIEKGQGGFPNGILTDKITTVKGPSIGQRFLGVIRPRITQHIVYNQQTNPDTLYFGKDANSFDLGLPVNITERESRILPQSVKNKLAKIIDSDYSEYNTSRGNYPYGSYEKTIDTKYKK